jgi:heat shock protein HtpX
MPANKIEITPDRSVLLFAILALSLAFTSFAFLLLLAVACVVLPSLLVSYSTIEAQAYLVLGGGIAAAGVIVWSLVPRRQKFESPGLQIDRGSQPQFFQELDGIAVALNEDVPDEVYLSGEPGAWVLQRRNRFSLRTRRVLVVGLPLFGLLNISELRAALAHEFAHFYSGDTWLGPWVYGAQQFLIRSSRNVRGMYEIGVIHLVKVFLTLVALIIEQYFLLFLQAIRFISRRQEFRSDELACLVAGKSAAIQAVTKVHAAAPIWPAYWAYQVSPVLNANCIPDIAGGFSQYLGIDNTTEFMNAYLEELKKTQVPDPYATHPPLNDRIAAMNRLPADNIAIDATPAFSLLLEQRLTERLFVEARNPHVAKGSLKFIDWKDVATQITIPAWRSHVEKFGAHLQQKTAAAAPELIEELHSIAAHLPDPPGMLLTANQRIERASALVAMAVGLLLSRNGWQLRNGEQSSLHHDGETLNPFEMLEDLRSGKVTVGDWVQMCVKNGIADEILGEVRK